MNGKRMTVVGAFLGGMAFTSSVASAAVTFVSASATQTLDRTTLRYNEDGSSEEVKTTTSDTSTSPMFTPVTTQGASSVTLSSPAAGTIGTRALLNALSAGLDSATQTNSATYQFSVDRASVYNFTGRTEYIFLGPHGGRLVTSPLNGSISAVGSGSISVISEGTTDVFTGPDDFGSSGFGSYLLGTGTYLISLRTSVEAGDFYGTQNFGTLDFSIADAVPEPANWAMMIVGFGLVGGMFRRAGRLSYRERRIGAGGIGH